jgi:hypothetical protein
MVNSQKFDICVFLGMALYKADIFRILCYRVNEFKGTDSGFCQTARRRRNTPTSCSRMKTGTFPPTK